ncbi:DUF2316 family protein [Luteimicrobium subarcticum]|uniref:DUF2316 family protein n=1 Tax=Luteimicrobium subarcticum TaxID=620910 RepID=A0A2M8WW26_9MICO|nr:DUF2316 family protein [Luteimicrobium subarcticum]PJI95117.1 hypothetical protein CLV34_0970 [Luteimicrobium subarcticum]
MLTSTETARTATELRASYDLTGLTLDEVATDLHLAPAQVAATLDVTPASDPSDVWLLRDYLDQAVRDAGRTPVPFSTLTRANKLKARMWFSLRRAPRHDFGVA